MNKRTKIMSFLCMALCIMSLFLAVYFVIHNNTTYAEAATAPNDPYYAEQWALHGEYGIDIEGAWEITTGSSSVRVGVIDNGINAHEDIDAEKVDEGYDFYYNNKVTDDALGAHGTFVAGIIGANSYNNIGISGVVP